MYGGPPSRPIGRPSGRSVLLASCAIVVVIALLAVLPARAGAGLLAACSGAFGVAMIRAVLTGRSAGPRFRALALAGGILLTAVIGAASGIAVLVAPGVRVAGVPLPAEIPLVGLFFVAGACLPAILRPPQRRDLLARLRLTLDAIGVAACLIFLPWLFLFDHRGGAVTALIFGGAAAATVAVAGVHAIRHRSALRWCAPGAALSLVCLAAFTIGQDFTGQPNAVLAAIAAGLASTVAAALMWHGTTRIRPDARPIPPAGSEPSAGFPLLTLPVLGAALITVYHLVNGGRLDAMSIVLGSTAIAAVGAREWVSAIALRRHADHLTVQGNRLRSLVFGSADVAMVLDADLAVRWQSPAAARQFGLSDQDVLGRSATALVHPDQSDAVHAALTVRMAGRADAGSLAVRLRDGFGAWRDTEWTTDGADPAEPGESLVVHVRDVSNVRSLERALQETTHLDRQTSLANSDGLRRASELIPDAGALIVIELGGLTAIADLHGPDLAEVVVVEAAGRLRARVTGGDVPARLGEHRFAVLTRRGAVRAHLLASQLVNALSAPYEITGTVAHVSGWAGLTDLVPDAGIDEVIRRATLAVRSVRSEPPGAVDWYEEQMEARLLRRSTLEQDLPGAVARGELRLTFQPIAELTGDRPAGVEALPAWRHPALGAVPAGELLALAEDLGLLGRIGDWALQQSCRLLAGWRRQHEELWLALAMRPRGLADASFQASLRTALELYRLPPAALVIEVTEQDLHEDVAAELGRLRADGLRTAVDDFGAGPTSLSRLRVLPIDLLKIDRKVFDEAGMFLEVTMTLGRRLGVEVIAGGLREPGDLETVRAAGCRLGQGELLGAPMPAEHLEAYLEQHRGSRRRS
ncbi:EAL domain-containing protein [Actinoplanes subtropicus]|uniref:EAL domain-containing protein n=1 Tax=Actinoplanes subtropicus TaxID=543632 RepID=UPI00068A1931|nr:EAL domain-containing protein [Actinoplanes subtropicus]